jgi:hypothetical protein
MGAKICATRAWSKGEQVSRSRPIFNLKNKILLLSVFNDLTVLLQGSFWCKQLIESNIKTHFFSLQDLIWLSIRKNRLSTCVLNSQISFYIYLVYFVVCWFIIQHWLNFRITLAASLKVFLIATDFTSYRVHCRIERKGGARNFGFWEERFFCDVLVQKKLRPTLAWFGGLHQSRL